MAGLDLTRTLCAILPFVGLALGHYLDLKETERMTMFRDKSALYGRPEGRKEPTW